MSKGFSGIGDLSPQGESASSHSGTGEQSTKVDRKAEQGKGRPPFVTRKGNGKESSPFVTYDSWHTMPGLWQSQDKGISWETEDYIFVFQYRPCSQTVVMKHLEQGGKPVGSLSDPAGAGLRYLWILCVYYKPGKGPKQKNDSMRWPVVIVTLEQANLKPFAMFTGKPLSELDCDRDGWDQPALCMFTPDGRANFGGIKERWGINTYSIDSLSTDARKQLEDKVIDFFLKTACGELKISEQPRRIGNMYNGVCAVYSDKMPPEVKQKILNSGNSSGCLGMLLLIPVLGVVALWKAIF